MTLSYILLSSCIYKGVADDVQAYVRRIRQLPWKSMVLKGERRTTIPSTSEQDDDDDDDECTNLINHSRLLPFHLEEVDSMSVIRKKCHEVGIEEIFL